MANLGIRSNSAQKYVAQLDPATGSILATSPSLSSLDGLTFDPYSGRLFATSLSGNTVYSINPNNLNDVIDVLALMNTSLPGPDGIRSDGLGNIFIASSDGQGDGHVYQLDLINNTLTQKNYVAGLDDLAPLLIVPEPSALSLIVFGLGALAPIALARRRESRQFDRV